MCIIKWQYKNNIKMRVFDSSLKINTLPTGYLFSKKWRLKWEASPFLTIVFVIWKLVVPDNNSGFIIPWFGLLYSCWIRQ